MQMEHEHKWDNFISALWELNLMKHHSNVKMYI